VVEARAIEATGLPLGMFCREEFSVYRTQLAKGDGLILFTDGLSEAQARAGNEFGVQPLVEILRAKDSLTAEAPVLACVSKALVFRAGSPPKDDLTLMAIERFE
jgi:sigma-B regulation protein RsbU (phosphoserine phosphatase)